MPADFPIDKRGDSTDSNNGHLIFPTPIISKVFEITSDQLDPVLEREDPLSECGI